VSRIVAYTPDVMDRSKVAAAGDCIFVSRPTDLAALCGGADIVVVDLTRPGVVDVLPLDAKVIGFANHTNRDVMEAARAAGCHEVLPRSDFFARIEELLAPSQP
jgi:hypothetical protein